MKLDFTGLKILVIGDPMIDRYFFGHVDRISPEAPVPVFVSDNEELRPGGAENVACQLTELGVTVERAYYRVHEAWWRTAWTCKTRYMVRSHQLLRVDKDENFKNTIPSLNGFHAIVISDYSKGACTPEICQEAIQSGLPVIVDPKGKDWEKYKGAAVICPNHLEYDERYRTTTDDSNIVIKRAADGLDLVSTYSSIRENYPALARHVFDPTGAGDTVTAVIAACVAKGIYLPTACKIANVAAGYVVGEVGTTVCPLAYLCENCASL